MNLGNGQNKNTTHRRTEALQYAICANGDEIHPGIEYDTNHGSPNLVHSLYMITGMKYQEEVGVFLGDGIHEKH